jgi:ATP-dependent Clp protease ATP-binding subunit ClpX
MTSRKHQKRLARARAAKTGEAYTTALRHLRSRTPRGADMPTGETTDRTVLSCSFCDRPSTEVAKLVAGPSVYICDSCVGLCNEILTGEAGADAEPAERPAGEVLLARIRLRARDMAGMEAELRGWVDEARTTFEVEWPRIAAELGTTPEEARRRFG